MGGVESKPIDAAVKHGVHTHSIWLAWSCRPYLPGDCALPTQIPRGEDDIRRFPAVD